DVLVYLTKACTSFEVWATVKRRFGAKSSVKISNMRHAFKMKSMCDNLNKTGNMVKDQEQMSIILEVFQ
ncbi:hypothetical protein J1N35_000778, partial [Gossypium stocksii]